MKTGARVGTMAVLLVALLNGSSELWARQAQRPALADILTRVQANLDQYDARVPSFFCEEHVVSSQAETGQRDQTTTADSMFRLKRSAESGVADTLVESRDVQRVDGKPAQSQHLDWPTQISGAFEGGLAIVSLNQAACMKYELQRTSEDHGTTKPYVVHFATDLTRRNTGDCLLQEKSKGRVVIDPASMQITHLEITTPRHTITNESASAPRAVGRRDIRVDYAPVMLGGTIFWMPSTIAMEVTRGSGTFHTAMWTFRATYRNYHKLEVTSRMLPRVQGDSP